METATTGRARFLRSWKIATSAAQRSESLRWTIPIYTNGGHHGRRPLYHEPLANLQRVWVSAEQDVAAGHALHDDRRCEHCEDRHPENKGVLPRQRCRLHSRQGEVRPPLRQVLARCDAASVLVRE